MTDLTLSGPAATAAGRGSLRAARLVIPAAAALSLLVAWAHLAYTQSHFREWWAYGVFFLATGIGQGVFAALLVRRPSRPLLLAGLLGNLGVIGMYILSRTQDVPLGPHAGVAEHTGTVDLVTTAGEIAIVVLLLALLDRTARRWVVNGLLVAGLVMWAVRLAEVAP